MTMFESLAREYLRDIDSRWHNTLALGYCVGGYLIGWSLLFSSSLLFNLLGVLLLGHAMVIAAWNLLVNGDFYRDPGPNYYTARQPARSKARAISQLETLGYRVILEPLTQSA